jgi:FKBP-type peptidyl-prolyl cis-trans isomerase
MRILLPLLLAVSCTPGEPAPDVEVSGRTITTPSGLIYEVVETGTGPVAASGQLTLIHETTQLADGTMIADTWQLNNPIRFLLGGKQVIDGLDEAVTGMRVGERRKLIVPPSLSKRSTYPDDGLYGPEDTLYYDVILLQISEP